MTKQRLPVDRLKPTSLPPEDEKPRPVAQERFSDEELEEIRKGFARRLKEIFDYANNSEIARRCKTTDVTIKYYVEGARLPHPEMLLQIHLATGVNLHWLLTGDGAKRVEMNDLFSEEEERNIQQMASERGLSFNEMARLLACAAADLVKKTGK